MGSDEQRVRWCEMRINGFNRGFSHTERVQVSTAPGIHLTSYLTLVSTRCLFFYLPLHRGRSAGDNACWRGSDTHRAKVGLRGLTTRKREHSADKLLVHMKVVVSEYSWEPLPAIYITKDAINTRNGTC